MFKFLKIIVRVVGICFGLLIPVAVILLLLLHTTAFKQHLQTGFSEAFSREVLIQGALEISFLQGIQFGMHDLHVRDQGTDIASFSSISIGIDLLPLLRGEIRLNNIEMTDPVLAIVRHQDGSFNFISTLPHVMLKLVRIGMTNANVRFTDLPGGGEYSGTACNLELQGLTPVDGAALNNFADLDIAATLACAEFRKNGLTLANVKLALAGNNRKFRFTPVTMQLFGAQATGSLLADLGGATPHYDLDYTLPQFMVGDFFTLIAPQHTATGTMDLTAHLTAQGQTLPELEQTLAGQISLQGKNLILNGSDLDEQFDKYETSQNFNLFDAGAVLFAGPLGLVVTKGFDLANISIESGTSSAIPAAISQWTVSNGVAEATDVAMKTSQNLLAVKGELDFPNGRFKNLSFALLDNSGCIKVEQAVSGTFQHPEIAKPNIFKVLTGPVRALLNKLKHDDGCTVFYTGSLAVHQ